MTNHKQAAQQGREAEQAKPVLDRAFDAVKASAVAKMLTLSPGDPQAILTLHAAIQGVEAARQMVLQEIATGQLAQAALEGEARLAEQNQR